MHLSRYKFKILKTSKLAFWMLKRKILLFFWSFLLLQNPCKTKTRFILVISSRLKLVDKVDFDVFHVMRSLINEWNTECKLNLKDSRISNTFNFVLLKILSNNFRNEGFESWFCWLLLFHSFNLKLEKDLETFNLNAEETSFVLLHAWKSFDWLPT